MTTKKRTKKDDEHCYAKFACGYRYKYYKGYKCKYEFGCGFQENKN